MNTTTETLKALIQLSGISQKQYAEAHNIEYKQFNHWVTGRRNISIENLQEIASTDGFKINVVYEIINL